MYLILHSDGSQLPFFFFTHTWADTVTPEEQKEMCNWLLHEALIMRMKSTQPQCK